MKLVALLNFYDERPDWLAVCVASLATCCDHVVAMDGAYAMFPQARSNSGDVQAGAIIGTAQALGLGVTYSAPKDAWKGNEVEKRNALVQMGKSVADPGDWFLVMDADMIVKDVPGGLHATLSETDCMVGTYLIEETFQGQAGRHPIRYLVRCAEDLHLTRTHFGYRRGDTLLWEMGGLPAVQTDLVIEHRGHERAVTRNQRGDEYDRRREVYGFEAANASQSIAS